ncbi:skin secretory protein xP2-like [Sorghum bicolor]|uniref:skin secretory protein xP2-like n=1 Tax=Sorghum bicolor TaxID=4558 RepID=UPI000B425BDB|nr:skin secretory protein xP2-like [Sorghum bicolor]|eukprot:XP_021303769.1 skin secretory protein xP2-like [Sorghum bicolor]
MENPAGEDPPEDDAARAASDVDPDHVALQRAAEPTAAVGDAAPQTTEQPAMTTAATSAEDHPAPAGAAARTPTRNEEAVRTPPPSIVVEEESRAPTPPAEERGVPTPPRAGASPPVGSPSLNQGPVMPTGAAGGSTANEETQTASDDDVEEIQDFEEEVARLRQEKEQLGQELAGALETGRRAGEELSNRNRELSDVLCSSSAASDVNPDHAADQGASDPAAVDAAPQAMDQPTAAAAAAGTEGQSAPASAAASTPPRNEEASRTPPPSAAAQEDNRIPTPAEEGRGPTPPRAGASSPASSPGLGRRPVMPSTAAGNSAANEEPWEASNDDVGEVQGRPRDGRQHVYMWRQREDHFIGHEELVETGEAARVERAAKRLVDEVKGVMTTAKYRKSAASDVNPDHAADQGASDPAAVDAAPQAMDQPTAVAAAAELAKTGEAARVERAAKRLVDEVKGVMTTAKYRKRL